MTVDFSFSLRFRGIKYINEYFGVAPKFNEIAKWLDNPKFASDEVNQLKQTADLELQMFEGRLKRKYVSTREIASQIDLIREVERLHEEGNALLEKWSAMLDPQKVLKAMMAAMGVEDDRASSPTRKPKPKAAGLVGKTKKKQKTAQSLKAKQHADEEARRKALEWATQRALEERRTIEEAERQAQLAATKADNAIKNAAQRQRQEDLALQKEAEAAERAAERDALLQRKQSWVDRLYADQQKLTSFNSDSLVDPFIFDGAADFDAACVELTTKGIYLGLRIHGNEKCVAMWKDHSGRNVMVWFDAPHGAQLVKGSRAGWAIGLHKALRDSGRLLLSN